MQFLLLLSVGLATVTISLANPNGRVVNGDVAKLGQFPWMVSLRMASSSSHNCGGCIVTPEHVVTAAHCVANDEGVAYLPSVVFVVTGHVSNVAGGRYSTLNEIRVHPEYAPDQTWRNDIAVLKLNVPIPFSATEQPIPLASSDVGVQTCRISGWGRTQFPSISLPSQLQEHVMNTITYETCIGIWGSSGVFESTLCAGGVRGVGICGGDSGGPLICNGELAGVVSWANPCANGLPDGYARVYYFVDWLRANIADLSPVGRIYMDAAMAVRNYTL